MTGESTNPLETDVRRNEESLDVKPDLPGSEDSENEACAAFQALMPERIGAGEDLAEYTHLKTCERCSALVRDLNYIAEAAAEFLRVEQEPPDKIWSQIQFAIEHGEA